MGEEAFVVVNFIVGHKRLKCAIMSYIRRKTDVPSFATTQDMFRVFRAHGPIKAHLRVSVTTVLITQRGYRHGNPLEQMLFSTMFKCVHFYMFTSSAIYWPASSLDLLELRDFQPERCVSGRCT